MTTHYDALVIGGGPAGATAAIMLARAGWSVAVIERKEFPRFKVCGEYLSATNLPLLDALDIADRFQIEAGPEIRRVGLFAGKDTIVAPLSQPSQGWGRAWTRAELDTCLLREAAASGAEVWQPWAVTTLSACDRGWDCSLQSPERQLCTLSASLVIAAHGSWDVGTLPTHGDRLRPRRNDLFGFKAHFRSTCLDRDLMPLVCFPGGYGGMVHCGDDCVSFSLCIRRDELARIRQSCNDDAGDAVLRHVKATCNGVAVSLDRAERIGRWLAAGPIRPGIRLPRRDELFAVGNAAGEAHPVVAEGISMAMQSAWLLATYLNSWRRSGGNRTSLAAVQREYAREWKMSFAPRIRAAAVIAHWAMRPRLVRTVVPVLRAWPQLLTWGSRWSGKCTAIVPSPPIEETSPA